MNKTRYSIVIAIIIIAPFNTATTAISYMSYTFKPYLYKQHS